MRVNDGGFESECEALKEGKFDPLRRVRSGRGKCAGG